MIISEMIIKLQAVQDLSGDLTVYVNDVVADDYTINVLAGKELREFGVYDVLEVVRFTD